ncbi:hypothetical protein [Tenggerimyces flavus]|uniref:Uncharacterized protein n=1 Tax=Tenggerimyces flavus TaxID=1708749 RepID=A0ABV7Y7X6_9ACTN|nr:hypothetical protein [Tenggerimyces flavus]MBM7788301.1 hypothetical protein [Tenggerimyces flavus]
MSPFRPIFVVGLGLLAVAISACSTGGAAVPDEVRGWERAELYSHRDVVEYDRVAVGSNGQLAAWLTRSRGVTDLLSVSAWGPSDRTEHQELDLPEGVTGQELIPAAIAVDNVGWTAVAEVRPKGDLTTDVAVWSGASRTSEVPTTLELPDGQVVSRTLAAGRSRTTAAVLALTGVASPGAKGLPEASRLILWTATIDRNGTTTGAWKRTEPDLGTRLPLNTAAIVGAGANGLVLAGTTRDGDAKLWTSADGNAWKPQEGTLPKGMAELELLAPLVDGSALVAWADQGRAQEAKVWRFDDGKLTDLGTIAGAEGQSLDLKSAATVDDRLVVAGSTVQNDTWRPFVHARNDDGEWIASDQADLVGQLDWSIEAIAAQGDDRLGAVMVSTPFHIDVSTWTWRRPTDAKS